MQDFNIVEAAQGVNKVVIREFKAVIRNRSKPTSGIKGVIGLTCSSGTRACHRHIRENRNE